MQQNIISTIPKSSSYLDIHVVTGLNVVHVSGLLVDTIILLAYDVYNCTVFPMYLLTSVCFVLCLILSS